MGCTLVIDTSFGSTVGIVGHEPIIETDSRTHVERLQTNIATAVQQAGHKPHDIDTIIVGTGPAPFTGLRAGIVAAKALAFATGARLIGHDILEPQVRWNLIRRGETAAHDSSKPRRVLTLAVNDARRKQLYFALYDSTTADDAAQDETAAHDATVRTLIDMDIDYPNAIVERVNAVTQTIDGDAVIDVIGHGATRYADILRGIAHLGDITDDSVLDQGGRGLAVFAADAQAAYAQRPDAPVEPLYLRRPDAEVPAPLKHVLGHEGAERTA
ncbi:tRNA (adenosine(37)-N6)-threonylcarbamoyltransferase complex dimerization subunit type 1 TsaB [Bifidobacterium leontopitheci]|uniref:tRNA threonylcarbamoyladenosine biosynthesis protein TsaB n=1 Tax=Bifidobacterium leontopitheci TaxID=2650774 RepID=A0A6I1GJT8_9BIFI|nr:tRNA (adenosine(37)-N6)-threonylcarbamoyltransferase complex dimerization subunit type 1 TsaB [Bifidobacterium leontopitheci]KAB7791012.1 tRNA threonylcarbamoyladenosine biosynthesis protein TsaB [Bifidobacterium leontopitheci]